MAHNREHFKNIRLKTAANVTAKDLNICRTRRPCRQEKFWSTADREKTFQDEGETAKALAEKGYYRTKRQGQDPEIILTCFYCGVRGKDSTGENLHGEDDTCAFNKVQKANESELPHFTRGGAECSDCLKMAATFVLSCGHILCKECCKKCLHAGTCEISPCRPPEGNVQWLAEFNMGRQQ